ncbi:hypothetical protein HMSSN036_69960 [Paenibacillus macerans]|nr:hypothetical protein HMSSN036_69960 [Paenibacillus macerans]
MLASFKRWGVLPIIAILFIVATAACGTPSAATPPNGNDAAAAQNSSPGEANTGAGQPGANGGGNGTDSTADAGGTKFPITIHHDKGETVLEEKPKKGRHHLFPVCGPSFCYRGAGCGGRRGWPEVAAKFPGIRQLHEAGEIADLGDTANMESILALDPDVIIAWEDDLKIYDQLAQIAPTILIHQSENWQDTITKVAAVLGEEEKAEQYIAGYDAKLDTLAANMDKSGVKGKTAIS